MKDTIKPAFENVAEPCKRYRREAAEENAALYVLENHAGSEVFSEFELHLEEGCAFCSGEVDKNRELLVDAACAVPPRAPPAALKGRLLAQIEEDRQANDPEAVQIWKRWASTVAEARDFYVLRGHEGRWEETSCSGVRFKKLAVDSERRYVTMLVEMEPGASYPSHRHGGAEECYVLEGDLHVAGEVLGPGDYQYAGAGSDHSVQATEHGCTLLIVSSQDDQLL